ncbi:DUF7248 family protein, partial [Escherichia coli]|uniref:DUF7248 family protein n=1 Tax=Escherichia coli TaxID=562 RepID=UPI0019636B22
SRSDPFRTFDRDFARKNRNFNIMIRVVACFIALCFVLVIGGWIALGFMAYNVVQDPNGTARVIGRTVGEFMKGVEDVQE